EFFEIYDGQIAEGDFVLPATRRYKEYISHVEACDKNLALGYWRDYLWGFDDKSSPSPAFNESAHGGYKKEEYTVSFDMERRDALQAYSVAHNVTLSTVIQAVWAIVLSRYCAKDDVVFGLVVSGRPAVLDGVETMVGLFINTVPLRVVFHKQPRLSGLLKKLREDYINCQPHIYTSLAKIQAEAALKNQLLDHIMVFENYPMAEKLEELSSDNKGRRLDLSDMELFEQSNYNLNIIVRGGRRLDLCLSYNANIYEGDFIRQLGRHVENMTAEILGDGDRIVSHIEMLSPQEKNRLLYDFNQTATNFP
ncbi:MAG: hypothetical protein GY765_30090, partial [bacterium]|nr:hypothetical protein [bacterium]